ncbi:MAG: polysaccharide biosynthesis protein [Bacteroidetes bacterium]|nr:MAG: polysaccharide biosynthesis protein [Bacteroidota bacterium]
MAGIKQLAGQTIWYGLSNMAAKFLNYFLTPYLTYKLNGESYGDMTLVYSAIPFLGIIFTYGLETSYFRFIQKDDARHDLYNTVSISIVSSTIFFTLFLWFFASSIAKVVNVGEHPEYIILSLLVVSFDTLCRIPFAKLRQEGRPVKFAFISVFGVVVNMITLYFLLSVAPKLAASNPNSVFTIISSKGYGVTFVLLSNLVQAIVTWLLLWKEFWSFRWHFNVELWKRIMAYSLPMLIAGLGGMVNETLDRIMLGWWGVPPAGSDMKFQIGTYGACYKLSILITIFIQAFRMGAEPFFFKQMSGENPQKVYARVMKFFVITICVMFLFVSLYLDIWKQFVQNPKMWVGLRVVPILLLANMFLGIYYNLSIWYKVINKTIAGAWITVIGAGITILINYLFIPRYGYMASAWATFTCYGSMMVLSYLWGQKEYPVPYAWKKLVAYIVMVVIIYFIHHSLTRLWDNRLYSYVLATLFIFGYVLLILKIERKEFQKLPYVGKYI